MFARNTYLEVNLKHLSRNIKTLIKIHPSYEYYFGVVKADCYGQGNGSKLTRMIIQSGCNYLAVATLDEALEIRRKFGDIPILCLGVVSEQYIEACIQNNITVTIPSLQYLEEIIEDEDLSELKVHLKINTGMNRLGLENNSEVLKAVGLIKINHIKLEGIYTHIYDAENEERYLEQVERFKQALEGVDLSRVPIIHMAASEALMNYEKPDFVNRLSFRYYYVWIYKRKGIRFRKYCEINK